MYFVVYDISITSTDVGVYSFYATRNTFFEMFAE